VNILSLGTSVGSSASVLDLRSSHERRAQLELRVGAFARGELEVVSVAAREALNEPFVYDVTFASAAPVEALHVGLFGFPACLSIETVREPRVIQGIAITFESIGAAEADLTTKTRRYQTRIVPRLWLLSQSRTYRVFQDKSAIEVACAVLDEAGIKPTLRLEQSEYPPIPFLYQRGESDLDFLHRVLAVAGVFYYFEHATGLLDALMPGAVELLGGAVGGFAGGAAGAASLAGGASVGVAGAGAGVGASVFRGGAAGDAVGEAVGNVLGTVAQALGAVTKVVLCDRSRHTQALGESPVVAVASAAVSGGLRALGAAVGGVAGSALHVADEALGAVLGGLSGALSFDANGKAATTAERVFSFRTRSEVRPKSVALREWDVSDARGVRMGEAAAAATLDIRAGLGAALDLAGRAGLSVGVQVGLEVDAVPIASKDVAVMEYQRDGALLRARDGFAQRALSQLRADRTVATGETDCRRLAPGYRFRLEKHPIHTVNTEYVATEVRMLAYAQDHLPSDSPPLFRADFTCVPSTVDPVPPKPAARPPLGLEPAVVVGPVWGDVNCDATGRIQVRFRWADAPRGAASPFSEPSPAAADDPPGTCWVHWLERWGGSGYGTSTLPRVGSEVIVDFLQEEGGRPIAIGQTYSRVSAPPCALPREGATVGIRSSVLDGGGYSEVALDDTTGDVRFRAQRHRRVDVLRDDSVHVTRDRRVEVGGNVDTRTAGSHRETVGGDAATAIGGAMSVAIAGDSATRVGGRLSVHADGGIDAEMAHLSPRLLGPFDLRVDGETRFVHGRSLAQDVAADEVRTVGGRQLLTLGEVDVSVIGPYELSSGDLVHLRAQKSIELSCGESVLRITPDGIYLSAPNVEAAAGTELRLSGRGPSLTIDDEVTVLAKKTTVQAPGARLELATDARLSGSKVRLGDGSGATKEGESGTATTNNVALRIVDADGKKVANATYQATIGDTLVQDTTDAAGGIAVKVPKDVGSIRIVVWPDDFPEGPRVTYVVDIEPLGDASTVEGAQRRLRNLGYYRGPITGLVDVATQDALLVFQSHAGIPLTGELDGPTSGQLATAHDTAS
jgi:uncharacterized protein involved in type VI secretion and phage assembly